MTKQFWKYQGLVRESGYVTFVMVLFIGYLYTSQYGTCVNGMTNDEDRDDVRMRLCMVAKLTCYVTQVEDLVDSLEGTIIVCAIFNCLKVLYQNVLVSTGSYKQVS